MNKFSTNILQGNADATNWDWPLENKGKWTHAPQVWQTFHQEWYGNEDEATSPLLSVARVVSRTPNMSWASIYIRQSYKDMFKTVLQAMKGKNGVIITGQPGTGKSLFLYYLLVRLLQMKQIVSFSPNGVQIFLFFHDGVYKTDAKNWIGGIVPLPKDSGSDIFIWSLLDTAVQEEPPLDMVRWPFFPVQSGCPGPARLKFWRKEISPLLTGLPLWSHDELVEGLKCQTKYPKLKKALEDFYSRPPHEGQDQPQEGENPLASFPDLYELLKARFPGPDGDSTPTPEQVVDFLLDEAIDQFGYSARDVFRAIFDHQRITQDHLLAFSELNQDELQSAVYVLASQSLVNPTPSHAVLAVNPVYNGPFKYVSWNIDFKSDWVGKAINGRLIEVEESEISRTISYFYNIPQARGLAGRFFEPVAHQRIAQTAIAGDSWTLTVMTSDESDAPHFKLEREIQVPPSVKLAKINREIVKVTSIDKLSASVKNNSYYIPTDATFPLFDSFVVELDFENKSGILWVFQVTTSRRHGGSRSGYEKVRKIIAELKTKLQASDGGNGSDVASVEVRYVLVVPEFEGAVTDWHFPPGWNQHLSRQNHQGKVYCLEIPLVVPPPQLKACDHRPEIYIVPLLMKLPMFMLN